MEEIKEDLKDIYIYILVRKKKKRKMDWLAES